MHPATCTCPPKAASPSTGSSAGADISLWLGFHDDLADPASSDPVARQSTRISAVGAAAAQTTLDMRVIAKLITEKDSQNPMFARMYGLRPDEMNTERAYKKFDEVSAVANLSKDDAPVFLYYSAPNKPITAEMPQGDRMHNPVFGFYLKERMDKIGVECVMRLREEYKTGNPGPMWNQEMVRFFLKHFPEK